MQTPLPDCGNDIEMYLDDRRWTFSHQWRTLIVQELHSGSGGTCPLLAESSQVCFFSSEHPTSGTVQNQTEEPVLLVVRKWPTQPWFLDLLEMFSSPPWPIPLRRDLLSQANSLTWHPNPSPQVPVHS